MSQSGFPIGSLSGASYICPVFETTNLSPGQAAAASSSAIRPRFMRSPRQPVHDWGDGERLHHWFVNRSNPFSPDKLVSISPRLINDLVEDRVMIDDKMFRRTFLERAGLAALSSGLVVQSRDTRAEIAVPNSTGTGSPKLKAPANACDCHMHIYDPARFPMVPSQRVPPTDAAVPQYRLLQKRIGTTRVVVVTPRNYATENQVTVDAIAQLGPDARGVAVLHPTV